MKITTKNFGEIEIQEENIITFKDGIPAFEDNKKFAIIDNPGDDIPFKWLQSLDDSNLAFIIVNPFIFRPDYEFDIPKPVLEKLQIEAKEDISVYSIVVIPADMTKMTANLSGPIIINIKTNLGKQIILEDNRYTTKHHILEELQNLRQVE